MAEHDLRVNDDGLSWCAVCGGAEDTLPTECPGELMDAIQAEDVIAGRIDFVYGQWLDRSKWSTGPYPVWYGVLDTHRYFWEWAKYWYCKYILWRVGRLIHKDWERGEERWKYVSPPGLCADGGNNRLILKSDYLYWGKARKLNKALADAWLDRTPPYKPRG